MAGEHALRQGCWRALESVIPPPCLHGRGGAGDGRVGGARDGRGGAGRVMAGVGGARDGRGWKPHGRMGMLGSMLRLFRQNTSLQIPRRHNPRRNVPQQPPTLSSQPACDGLSQPLHQLHHQRLVALLQPRSLPRQRRRLSISA